MHNLCIACNTKEVRQGRLLCHSCKDKETRHVTDMIARRFDREFKIGIRETNRRQYNER